MNDKELIIKKIQRIMNDKEKIKTVLNVLIKEHLHIKESYYGVFNENTIVVLKDKRTKYIGIYDIFNILLKLQRGNFIKRVDVMLFEIVNITKLRLLKKVLNNVQTRQ